MTALTRDMIIAEARRWLRTPYAHQASLIHVGCDCLGLVRGVWRALIGEEPEMPGAYGPDWPLAAREEPLLAAAHRHLKPIEPRLADGGDIMLFRWRDRLAASHVGILTSHACIVHAHEGAAVCEVVLTSWWRRHLAGAFSFPGVRD